MKKMTLLFTLSLVGSGQLYGMEQLPKDIHHEIVRQAIESSNTLEGAIEAVNVACALQGVCYNNLKEFTNLVHILSDKFQTPTNEVAEKFNTAIAKKYLEIGSTLVMAASFREFTPDLVEYIKNGADVNYSSKYSTHSTVLMAAISHLNDEAVKLLLNAGANITTAHLNKAKSVVALYQHQQEDKREKAISIRKMLEEAMKKQ